jgi:hypothetical protein
MAAPTQAVNVYYRRIALHVFDCPPCQFRRKRKEYFDALTDAEPGPGLEADPAFGWIYAFASRRQRNRFQEFRGSARYSNLRAGTNRREFLRDTLDRTGIV